MEKVLSSWVIFFISCHFSFSNLFFNNSYVLIFSEIVSGQPPPAPANMLLHLPFPEFGVFPLESTTAHRGHLRVARNIESLGVICISPAVS